VTRPHVEAELVAETASIKPGEPLWVALRLKMEDGWHVYWRNPGDSGLPPHLAWELPAGSLSGPIEWPAPRRFGLGPLVDYGYEGEVLLPSKLTPAQNLAVGTTARLAARADWLVCREACLPGKAELDLELPVKADDPLSDARWGKAVAETLALLPRALPEWRVRAEQNESVVTLRIEAAGEVGEAIRRAGAPSEETRFFPETPGQIENAAPQRATREGGGIRLVLERSRVAREPLERLRGLLISPTAWTADGRTHALAIDVPVAAALR
jgi:DsbC/DsbD-like thiol-disulfide interchange protein